MFIMTSDLKKEQILTFEKMEIEDVFALSLDEVHFNSTNQIFLFAKVKPL